MMLTDRFHRILSGSPMSRGELIFAGGFVLQWWLMDVVQFVDWLIGKLL